MEVEKSCVTFLLCGPCWYVHKPDVQNKWDGKTHTHTHRLCGRAVNSLLFCASRRSDSVASTRWCIISMFLYSKFAPDDHGTRFSTWRRSEDIVSRVAYGVYSFNPCSQTTVKKKQKNKNKKNIVDGPCPCDARAAPKIAVP